uniref:Paraquat-inducible protein A n=1 Tax=Grammatophora oceanica TaxID=210454 RepID=A0A7S1Y4K2_9STRA
MAPRNETPPTAEDTSETTTTTGAAANNNNDEAASEENALTTPLLSEAEVAEAGNNVVEEVTRTTRTTGESQQQQQPLLRTFSLSNQTLTEEVDYSSPSAVELARQRRPTTMMMNRPRSFGICRRLGRAYRGSLSCARTTPCFWKYIIPLLTIATHLLFFYGQTAPMWRLVLQKHVDVWANATTVIAKQSFKTLGLPTTNHFYLDEDIDVRSFTYSYAITELWEAKFMPGKLLPRLAAVLLIVFSGIWPHLKLLLLNLTFLFSTHTKRRSRILHWLGCLGKWSLADILVVCVMVGVLNLDWEVDPTLIKAGMVDNLPTIIDIIKQMYNSCDLCSQLLGYTCHKPPLKHIPYCSGCQGLVDIAFDQPSWAQTTGKTIVNGVRTSGGGLVDLRVVGMKGIYAFCSAVILSILLSLIVDILDHKYKQRTIQQERAAASLLAVSGVGEPTSEDDGTPVHHQQRTTVSTITEDGRRYVDDDDDDDPIATCTTSLRNSTLAWLTLGVVAIAILVPTMERRVHGAIPIMLGDILGVEWNKHYSLTSLMFTTGQFGGWDYMLMGTFALFMVFGPAFRSFLTFVAMAFPVKFSGFRKYVLQPAINFVGAFCAWEVFAVALIMVQLLMPTITATIINRKECSVVEGSNGQCLGVEFAIQDNFALVVIGGLLLVGTSAIATTIVHPLEPCDSDVEIVLSATTHDYVPLTEEEEDGLEYEQEPPPQTTRTTDLV